MALGDIEDQPAIGVVDYVVFSLTLGISLGIGIYHACTGGKQRTTSEYLVGNRQMKVIPVAISLVVSYESSIMMLGWPGEMYVYGVQQWLFIFGILVSCPLIAQLLVPLFAGIKCVSGYEYLERRFNSRLVRLFGSFLGIVSNLLYMSVVLYGPATALEAVTQFPTWISIFVVAICAIIYTSIGGIKAVIWADAFQFFIMIGGMLALIVKATIDAGGLAEVWRVNGEGGRLNLFVFDMNPTVRHTFWAMLIGSMTRGLGLGTNQTTIQRIATMPTVNKAKFIVFMVFPGFLFAGSLACFEGLIAYAYYHRKQCDPLDGKLITNPNQIIPYLVIDVFRNLPGMSGVFLAALFSACLSTLSSGYASICTLLWSDFIKPHVPKMSEYRATLIAKGLVVITGFASIGMAQVIKEVQGPMSQDSGRFSWYGTQEVRLINRALIVVLILVSINSAFIGPLVGMFLLAAFFPFSNYKGALIGGVVSMMFSMWLGFGSNFSPLKSRTPYLTPITTSQCPNITTNITDIVTTTMMTPVPESYTSVEEGFKTFYSISYMWFAPIGVVGVIIIGLITSFITGASKATDIDPIHLTPFFDRVCCCLPGRIRAYLRCGVDYSHIDERIGEVKDSEITMLPPAEQNSHNADKEDGKVPTDQFDTDTTKFSGDKQMADDNSLSDINMGYTTMM